SPTRSAPTECPRREDARTTVHGARTRESRGRECLGLGKVPKPVLDRRATFDRCPRGRSSPAVSSEQRGGALPDGFGAHLAEAIVAREGAGGTLAGRAGDRITEKTVDGLARGLRPWIGRPEHRHGAQSQELSEVTRAGISGDEKVEIAEPLPQ